MKAPLWFTAVVGLAIVLGAIAIARRAATFTPTSDTAVIESFTGLAASGDLQLGPYSRYQWHHPGPLAFYALAPSYEASGRKTVGLNAGALLINLAGLACALWLASRRASPIMATMIAVGVCALLLRVPELLVSPWNPHLPVIAVLALLVASAAAMSAFPLALPAVALFASIAGQTHVALMPLALTVGLASTAGFALSSFSAYRRRLPDAPPPETIARVMAAADVLVLVLWAPPLFEQFTTTDGNLGQIWRYFVEQTHSTPAFAVALSAWADMMTASLRPDLYLAHGWPFVESPVRWAEAVAGLELGALLLFLWLSVRDRQRFDAALSGVLLGASLLSLWAVTRSDRELFDHVIFWIAAIGALNLAVTLALITRLLLGLSDLPRPSMGLTACAASFALVLWAGVAQLSREAARASMPTTESLAAERVGEGVRRAISDRRLLRPVIRFDQEAWGMAAGVVVDLQRRGIPVAVEDDWLAMYTAAFRPTGLEPSQIAIVGKAQHLQMPARANDIVIASAGDLLFAHLLIQ